MAIKADSLALTSFLVLPLHNPWEHVETALVFGVALRLPDITVTTYCVLC